MAGRSAIGYRPRLGQTSTSPAAGSAPLRPTLFLRASLPRERPRLNSFFGAAVEEFQLPFWYSKVVALPNFQGLRRSQPRNRLLVVPASSGQQAGNNPLRSQVL